MGKRLGWIDRTPDIARAIGQVAAACEAENVDVLLICGDLFDGSTRPEVVRFWMDFLSKTFGDFLRRGGTVLALTGNHDNENLAQALRQTMALAAPKQNTLGGVLSPGRLHLFAGPTFFRLEDRGKPGHHVQFIVMPGPTVARYLDEEGQRFQSAEERNRALKTAFKSRLGAFLNEQAYDKSLHTVLAAHIMTGGAEVRDGKSLGEAQGVVLDDGELPTGYAYVALGDIHRPQSLMNLPHVRYCGSIDRMDMGEAGEQKGIVLFDIGPAGREGEPRFAKLDATPLYKIRIEDAVSEMPGLAGQYPEHERALVKLSVRYQPARDEALPDLLASLEKMFPRCYDREITTVESSNGSGNVASESHAADMPATVRAYVGEQLAADDPDRPELLRIVDELLERVHSS
jgi:exonuclease SbcD